MRYKHFLPVLFLFCTTLLWAQSPERPRKEIPLITNVIASIDKAEGWMLQNNGEWIGAKNKIPFRNYAVNKRKSGKYELGQQNFDHINLRAITINNTIYSILLIYAEAGEYEFPVLEEKWDQYNTLTYFVFKESKWGKIFPDSVVFNRPYAVNTELVVHGEIDNFSEESYLFEIENSARQAIYQQTKSTSNLIFAAYPVQIRDEKFFRFKLYETINKREIYIKYLLPHNRDKLFKNFYFEMDYADDGNYQKALGFLEQITPPGQGETQLKYFIYRGTAKHQIGDFTRSIADFTKAIEVEGETTDWHMKAYFNRGISKFQTGDKSGACLDRQKALELGLKDQDALEYVHNHCKN